MYNVVLSIKFDPVCEVDFKSITQVCKFLASVNFDLVNVDILSPSGRSISAENLLEVWLNG